MRFLHILTATACLLPAVASAQLAAKFGPRGEVVELRVGGEVYFQDLALSVVKPGWSGNIADQRALDPASVKTETSGPATVYTAKLNHDGGRFQLRQTVEVVADRVSLRYEVTPEQEVQAEAVLLQGIMPAKGHAGKTRYVIAGSDVVRGVCPAQPSRDSHVLVGGGAVDWAGFAGPKGPALRVTPGDVLLQFQDNRKWNSPCFALLAIAGGGKLAPGRTLRFSLTFCADTAERIEADSRTAVQGELSVVKFADDRPLAVDNVSLDNREIEVFSPVELTADVAARYDNPFDPDQIVVDAHVSLPDGKTVKVPGFYFAPMRLETRLGAERLRLDGPCGFRVRFTPTVEGKHRLVLKVTDRSGTATSAPTEFSANRSDAPGFVRVARQSPRYFAHDNGRPYFAVGENLCWAGGRTPIADYAAWLKGLGAAGGNWARLWLAYNEKGLEWMPAPTPKPGTGAYLGLGRYALDNAWRLDEVLRLARQNGVCLMFCLGTYGEFTEGGYFNEGCWISNPYHARNGGPCAKPDDFWTDPQARKRYKQRLRYLVARWGYSPNVFAWEFWNEVPSTPERDHWVAEMAAYLKQHDPNRHLVSTTYGTASTWKCPDVDFSMRHFYGQGGNIADFTPVIAGDAHEAIAHNKPYLLAEFGIDWQTGDNRWDPKGTGWNMHNGAWASVMSGAAGTSMLWYWDAYVHPFDLYRVLTPVRRFADTVDWPNTRFTPLTGITVEAGPDQPETFADVTIPGTVEWGLTPSSEYTVRRDGKVDGGPVAMAIGSPQRAGKELHTQLTWHLDMPRAGKVTFRLGQVCSRAVLRVSLDNRERLRRELAAGAPGKGPWKTAKRLDQWNVWISDYDSDIAIEVPAGRHDLSFANADGDWLQIRSLTLPGYRSSRYPDVNVLGLLSDRLLLLWLHNSQSTWRTEYDGKEPKKLAGIRVTVPAPRPGPWHVEWWDTFQGRVFQRDTVEAKGGRLPLVAPDFARDLAVKICDK